MKITIRLSSGIAIISALSFIVNLILKVLSKETAVIKVTNVTLIVSLIIAIASFITMFVTLQFARNKQEKEEKKIIEQENHLKELEKQLLEESIKTKINQEKEKREKYIYKCKYCNCTYDNEIKFCPSCGAKIEKTTKEE